MPTDMKKKPSSRPSNGSTSACSSCRYSDSASTTPAAKAPRDRGRPAAPASAAAPTTISSAVAVNSSRVRAPPMALKIGRSRKRPASRIAPMAPTTFRIDSQMGVALCSPARIGTKAIRGMEARSWNSRTEKLSRPEARVNSPRSASKGRTMAVDDRASPKPSMAAPAHGAPVRWAMPENTAPVTSIWAEPSPNTERRMAQIRARRSSRPMMNSSIKTPSSLMSAMLVTSVTSRRPDGPIRTPATR